MEKSGHLSAEWCQQSCVIMVWPHKETDWYNDLSNVQDCYTQIAIEILKREKLLVVATDTAAVIKRIPIRYSKNLVCIEEITNDTWIRDYGPLSLVNNDGVVLLDFKFNGWGNKYKHEHDDQITQLLYEKAIFSKRTHYKNMGSFILEGGSIESDGAGTILTTESCLLSSSRNTGVDKYSIENKLKDGLGISRILWLKHAFLEGDDTDGHIDMLVRFCDCHTITYVKCPDVQDVHYAVLQAMESELKELRQINGKPYTLVPVPLPAPVYNEEGDRLPATYVNFLILNGAVLVPQYQCREDRAALAIFQNLFPDRTIVGINALPLIKQGGSIHCATMQIPEGVL